jgi:hypothetical protein
VTVRRRIDRLQERHRPRTAVPSAEDAYAKLAERLERHAPIPAGVVYADGYARLGAVLDRYLRAGIGIPAGPQTPLAARLAAICGMTLPEYRAFLRARSRGEA